MVCRWLSNLSKSGSAGKGSSVHEDKSHFQCDGFLESSLVTVHVVRNTGLINPRNGGDTGREQPCGVRVQTQLFQFSNFITAALVDASCWWLMSSSHYGTWLSKMSDYWTNYTACVCLLLGILIIIFHRENSQTKLSALPNNILSQKHPQNQGRKGKRERELQGLNSLKTRIFHSTAILAAWFNFFGI